MKTSTLALPAVAALLLVTAAPARAEPERLYLGDGSHLKLALGFGLAGREDSDLLSLQPTLEARLALGRTLGIELVVPTMFVDLATDDDTSASRFEIGNPTLALEVLLGAEPGSMTLLRGGVALPLVSYPEVRSLESLSDAFMQAVNVAMASGSHGLFDVWRYAPETLSLFVEMGGVMDDGALYVDGRVGAGLLIPIDDDSDTEIVVQALGRIGYGGVARPFVGVGVVLVPTEIAGLSGDDDAFQLSLQLGALVALGRGHLEAYLLLNIDRPAGFSFDDDGIFGIHVSTTVPF